MNQKERRLLTIKETADFLRISPRTIYNGTQRNAKNPFPVKPKRIGRLLRFDRRELEDYIEKQ